MEFIKLLNNQDHNNHGEELWPYILPLPRVKKRQCQILFSVFKSKVPISIIEYMPLDRIAYQKNMIEKFPFSNKTLIKWLKTLVSINILTEGMERTLIKGKVKWVKWYRFTPIGKWIKLLITPLKHFSKENLQKLIEELFELYTKSIIKFCINNKIDPKFLKSIFESVYSKETQKH